MDKDIQSVTLSALKFICGEKEHICRLCFASTENQEFTLQDNINIQRTFLNETITCSDVFDFLGITKECQLPQVLCIDCATITINCYLFQRLCQYSDQIWNNILNKVEKGLTKASNLNSSQQLVYFVIENDDVSTYSSRKKCKTRTSKAVLQKMKIIMKGRYNYLKNKEIFNSICCFCGEEFTTKIQLEKHMKSHKNDGKNAFNYPCKNCARNFKTSASLHEHTERVHYPKKIQCPKCSEMVSTEKMLGIHNKMHHVPMTCKLCLMTCPSKIALRSHLDKHEIHTCPRCNKVLLNKQTFRFHLKICGNDDMKKPLFFCDICNKGYARKFSIRAHLKTEHGFGKVLSCSWCGKKFDAKSKLNNHIVKHTRERNFRCNQCNGKFVTQAALVYHIRLHTGERPFPCDLCDESFLSASRRMEHKRRKHFGPSKECHICHLKYTTNNQLKKHIERHYNPHSKLFVPDASKIDEFVNNNLCIYET